MDEKLPLTTEEVAKILKISKYTLYELVKRGDISAQRVGRQLRFDPEALSFYLKGEKSMSPSAPGKETDAVSFGTVGEIKFAGSHDPAVEMLVQFAQHLSPRLTISTDYTGSMQGVMALYQRQASMAGVHLWDTTTGEYNLPFIHYNLPGEKVSVVNFVQRVQGWIVPPGNPLEISGWNDITRDGLRFVNRQKGSGTRIRLDSYLQQAGTQSHVIKGYEIEENTHFGVAFRVANNEADAGIGVQAIAVRLGLDFVPLFEERFDFVCLQEFARTKNWRRIMEIINSPGFHHALDIQTGYNTSLTGQIVYQS